MLKTLIFSAFIGILSTCISSPWFWKSLVGRKTVYTDETHIGFSRTKTPREIIKNQLIDFITVAFPVCFMLYSSFELTVHFCIVCVIFFKGSECIDITFPLTKMQKFLISACSILTVLIVSCFILIFVANIL